MRLFTSTKMKRALADQPAIRSRYTFEMCGHDKCYTGHFVEPGSVQGILAVSAYWMQPAYGEVNA
jgi:hypothetical protein